MNVGKFTVGQTVRKIGGSYDAEGLIKATFLADDGSVRYVFRFNTPPGLLHIFSESQLVGVPATIVPSIGTSDQVHYGYAIRHADGKRWRTMDSIGCPDWTEDLDKALVVTIREHIDLLAQDDLEDVRVIVVAWPDAQTSRKANVRHGDLPDMEPADTVFYETISPGEDPQLIQQLREWFQLGWKSCRAVEGGAS
jgi:hypothetical protein